MNKRYTYEFIYEHNFYFNFLFFSFYAITVTCAIEKKNGLLNL